MIAALSTTTFDWFWLGLAAELFSIGLIPHVLYHKRNPLSALSWIWALLLFPVLGPICYLAFGTEHLQRKRLRRRKAHLQPEQLPDPTTLPPLPSLAKRLEKVAQADFQAGCTVRLIPEAEEFYAELEREIGAAQSSIHVEFFIWQPDPLGQRLLTALAAAARRGVEVRVLLDELGSWKLKRRHLRGLEEAGGEWSWFSSVHPLRQRWFLHLRNHRKLVVIDGRLAWAGGMNVGEEYCVWRDLHARFEGPVVAGLQSVFADDWFFGTSRRLTQPKYYPPLPRSGEACAAVLAAGPDQDASANTIRLAILAFATSARERLWICSPYLVPDPAIVAALQLAARSGVQVRIVIPSAPDSFYIGYVGQSFYDDLLSAGVRIFEHTAGMLHTKALVLDDAWSMVGSANLDVRSLKLNFELNVAVHCPATNAALARNLAEAMKLGVEVKKSEFARRGLLPRLREGALRLLAPVL
ncbi:MAG: cardiolipin synthase [Verrucomicrobia bacterium]|nr:cardiolipin synthase [Verrucomicrobiota bacterium]